jgi:hypothetical protein
MKMENIKKPKRAERSADERRNEKLKKKYGITISQYKNFLVSQDDKCKCCGDKFTGPRTTHVDYRASTKKVIGLLCINCNLALSHLKESEERARALLEYVISTQ